jgi:hypothetical protein
MHKMQMASRRAASIKAHKPYRICIAVSPDVSDRAERKAARLGQSVSQYGSSVIDADSAIQEVLPELPLRTLVHELARHTDMALADGVVKSVELHNLTDIAAEYLHKLRTA